MNRCILLAERHDLELLILDNEKSSKVYRGGTISKLHQYKRQERAQLFIHQAAAFISNSVLSLAQGSYLTVPPRQPFSTECEQRITLPCVRGLLRPSNQRGEV